MNIIRGLCGVHIVNIKSNFGGDELLKLLESEVSIRSSYSQKRRRKRERERRRKGREVILNP